MRPRHVMTPPMSNATPHRRFPWSRRRFLQSLSLGAGATLLSPILRNLVSEARGEGIAARRVVFVLSGNGFLSQRTPTDKLADNGKPLGGGRDRNEQLWDQPFAELAPMMASLGPHRDKVTILQDLSNGTGGGHYQKYASLSCTPNGPNDSPGGITIDQHIANEVGGDTAFPLLGLGVSKNAGDRVVQNITAFGPDRPVSLRANPTDVYDLLFGPSDEAGRLVADRNRLALDHLLDDIRRARNALGPAEQVKLEQYLAVVEGTQQRQQALGALRSMGDVCGAPTLGRGFSLEQIEGRQEAMFDMATMALVCGMTRVVTLAMCTGRSFDAKYEGLGYTMGLHGIGHGGTDPAMGKDAPIHDFHASLIARMIDTLASVPSGDGTLMDDTLIVWTNENGEDHHSRPWHPWTVVLIGNAGGALAPGGRWVRFPSRGKSGHRGTADVWATVADVMGAPVGVFPGTGPAEQNGPLDLLYA